MIPAGPAGMLAALSDDCAAAVERAGRSTVAIHARRRIPSSGIVWRPGIVVTAGHTVTRDDDITITLGDGTAVPAALAGRDAGTDLAVLRLEGGEAPAAELGGAEELRVGRLVLAVGRPGRDVTASMGVVSAVGGEWRTWSGGRIDRFVRLDLAIYDGYSGGPLVAPGGRVLGVNTSGLARALALTVPAATVDRVADQLLATGRIARGYLGIATQPVRLPDALRERHALPQGLGLVVVNVEPGGPADQAGLLLGDVLVALDGASVSDPTDVLAALGADRVGQRLETKLLRAGELRTIAVTIGERPERGERSERGERPWRRGRR